MSKLSEYIEAKEALDGQRTIKNALAWRSARYRLYTNRNQRRLDSQKEKYSVDHARNIIREFNDCYIRNWAIENSILGDDMLDLREAFCYKEIWPVVYPDGIYDASCLGKDHPDFDPSTAEYSEHPDHYSDCPSGELGRFMYDTTSEYVGYW